MMGAQIKKQKAAEKKNNKSKIENHEATAPETEILMIEAETGEEPKQEIEAGQRTGQEIEKIEGESRKPKTVIIDAQNVEERGARRSRLRTLRKGLGLTQTEVARAAGLGLSTYYALENKYTTRKFSEEVFKQVAKVLHTTPQYILFGSAGADQASETGSAEKSVSSSESGAISAVRLKALITLILGIEDLGVFSKIEEYVKDQKEFMALKQKSATGIIE